MLVGVVLLLALIAPSTAIRSLSPKAIQIYRNVHTFVQNNPKEAGVHLDDILTSGKVTNEHADYGTNPSFCKEIYYPSFVQAEHEVLLTTFLFDRGSPCAAVAANALEQLNTKAGSLKRRIRVYMIISTISELMFMNKKNGVDLATHSMRLPSAKHILAKHGMSPAEPGQFNLPSYQKLSNLDFKIKAYHRWFVGAIHDKLLIVDGKVLVTGSKNWDMLHGYEYATRIEGPVAAVTRRAFVRMWQAELPPLPLPVPTNQEPEGQVPMLYLPRISNPHLSAPDSPQNVAWLSAMDAAQTKVFIMSPNFVTKAIMNKVVETVKRGVKVTIITAFSWNDVVSYFNRKSAGNNRSVARKMYRKLKNDPAVKNLEVCYFLGKRVQPPKHDKKEFAHVKFMAVDDEFVIFGSGNQDTQSWYNSSESNFLVDDPSETKRMVATLLKDQNSLQYCTQETY
jgi:phosphatidylserine/phosphatidylglycerophosphate/cardiolipin synthase-like enzyme